MVLAVRKIDDRRLRLDDARSMYAWTSYEVRVSAADFRETWSAADADPCVLTLTAPVSGSDVELAQCLLYPDPLRRDVRRGTLVVGDSLHASRIDRLLEETRAATAPSSSMVGVVLKTSDVATTVVMDVSYASGAGTVLHAPVPLVVAARTEREVAASLGGVAITSGDMWTQSSASPAESGGSVSFDLADRNSVSATLDLRRLPAGTDVRLLPKSRSGLALGPSDPFDAWLLVATLSDDGCARHGSWSSAGRTGATADVLGDILVDGSAPEWDYADSVMLPSASGRFTIHVYRLPGQTSFRATFRADGAVPAGVEPTDHDGDPVPGAGVNGGD